MKMDYILLAKQVENDVIKWRRHLHQIPELGLELPNTVAYVCTVLDELGVEYEDHYINGNGIVATIKGDLLTDKSPVVALRADMDGLPIQEETGLSFAAEENMHACGHDGHTAILLGVAKVFKTYRHLLKGTVKLIFQPGEEYPGGAKHMVEEGALSDPIPDQIFGFHIGHLSPEMPEGKIATRSKAMMASMDRFKITLKGKGFHAAYPEQAQDPLIAMTQLVNAIQTIVSRNSAAVEPVVVSVTRINGGFNQNIIPDEVEIEGTVRTFSDSMQRKIHQRLNEISKGISIAMNVEYTLEYDYKYPALMNTMRSTQFAMNTLDRLFGEDNIYELEHPVMGGEDFAFYLQTVPGAYLYLSNPGYIEGQFYGHHHSKFDIDEAGMYKAVASFLALTIEYFDEQMM